MCPCLTKAGHSGLPVGPVRWAILWNFGFKVSAVLLCSGKQAPCQSMMSSQLVVVNWSTSLVRSSILSFSFWHNDTPFLGLVMGGILEAAASAFNLPWTLWLETMCLMCVHCSNKFFWNEKWRWVVQGMNSSKDLCICDLQNHKCFWYKSQLLLVCDLWLCISVILVKLQKNEKYANSYEL